MVKRIYQDKRVGAKAWFDIFTEYLTKELNYKFSAERPRLGRNEEGTSLTHAGDLIFTGDSKYNKIFLPKIQDRFDTSVSKIGKIGDEFSFLSKRCKLENDGLWIQPGNYIQQMLKAYEEQDQTSAVTIRQLSSDGRQVRNLT